MALGGLNCGNCGAELPWRFQHSRMITCPQCGTTSVLRDKGFELAGSGGVMQDAPSLVTLGDALRVGSTRLTPVGHARFGYGRGWWDEYWCIVSGGDSGCWLSVDEGDYAIEYPLAESRWPNVGKLALGQTLEISGTRFIVTEAESATCLAIRGEFPEELILGETHLYYDLSGPAGEIVTFEVWDDGRSWTIGNWVDPWDVHAA